MVLYAMNALKKRRPDPQLIPEVLPIYNVIAKRFRLEPVTAVNVLPILANGHQVKGLLWMDRYDYHYCVFHAAGAELEFKINPRTQVAEDAHFSPNTDPITLKTLLSLALDSLRPMLYYSEIYVSAYEPKVQRILADLGFTATGYIPGWEMVNGQREDRIIFSWVRDLPARGAMELTPKAQEIVDLFLSIHP